ncbi:MAG: EAL domain-containing protein, partial [Eubacteriales bacterium]|nr:EAL domain-containing protein [Eubacteriales bacterium]
MDRGIIVAGAEPFRRAVESTLEKRLWSAENAAQALDLLRQHGKETDALLISLSASETEALLSQKMEQPEWDGAPALAVTHGSRETARALELGAVCAGEWPLETLEARLRSLQRLREAEALRRAGGRDALTGLNGRYAFYREVQRCLREQPDERWSVIALDVDHFKAVNELFGYEAGDGVLKVIARTLQSEAGERGVAARLESDRFAACMASPDLDALTARLNAALKPLLGGLRATLYAGAYPDAKAGEDVGRMCDRALTALKTVKGSFLKQWAVYDVQMRETMLREQALMADLSGALEREEFVLYFQPLFSITSGDPISAEALVRWQHPERGLLSPGVFVPLFERNGMITRLDAYVWEKACQYLQSAMRRGQPVLPVSVNVSRLNLYRPHLCEEIVALVERYGVELRLLKLEITESAYTDNPRQLLEAMKTLHAHGFEILMDDFGSGYSSLNMLKEVPVDILKMDMRFLDDFEKNGRAGNVMTSVVRMAKWLQIVVVAEGVETQAQIDFLRSIGCDRVQGFYFSKPLPIPEFEKLLVDQASGLSAHPHENEQTLLTTDFDAVWETSQRTDMLFGGMLGAIGLYERVGGVLEVVRVNDGYYQLMGCTPASLFSDDKNVLTRLEPPDQAALLGACDRAVKSGAVEETQIRRRRDDGRRMWLSVRLRYLGRVGTRQLYYMASNDISRLKTLERGFLLSQYGSAMLDAYFSITELAFEHNRATVVMLTSGEERFRSRVTRLDYLYEFHARHCVHPDDRRAYAELYDEKSLRALFADPTRASVSLELRMRKIGGAYKWVRLNLYPLHEREGELRVISCCRVIDGQKQAELMHEENRVLREKQRAQELYRTVVEQMGTALLEWSIAEQKASCSERFRKYALGDCDVKALCEGLLPPDVARPQDEPQLKAFFAQWHSMQGRVETTVRLRRKDGAYPWCTLRAALIRDASHAPERVIVTLNDVDAERKTQLLLSAQQSENDRRLAMLTNLYWTLPCGIWQFSAGPHSYTVFNNRACWELFGFTHKQTFEAAVAGDPTLLIHPDDRGR